MSISLWPFHSLTRTDVLSLSCPRTHTILQDAGIGWGNGMTLIFTCTWKQGMLCLLCSGWLARSCNIRQDIYSVFCSAWDVFFTGFRSTFQLYIRSFSFSLVLSPCSVCLVLHVVWQHRSGHVACVLLGVLYFFHLSDSLRDDSILVCKCCEKFRYDPFPTPDGPKVAAFWHQAKRNAIRRGGKVGWVTVAGLERIWTFPTCAEMSWYLFVFGWFPRNVSDWVVVFLFLPATRSCSFHWSEPRISPVLKVCTEVTDLLHIFVGHSCYSFCYPTSSTVNTVCSHAVFTCL